MSWILASRRALTIVVCVLCLNRVAAQEGMPPGPPGGYMQFDIPALPLQIALERFMSFTSYSGLYDSALTAGLHSPEIRGAMHPEAALRRMLSLSGLQVRYASPDTFSLVAASAESAGQTTGSAFAQGSESTEPERKYFAVVQSEVRAFFCRLPVTSSSSYRIALSLWIEPSGRVTKVHLLGTSGSPSRDASIRAGLHGMHLPSQPGHGEIRQPLTMIVLPALANAQGECIG